MKPTAAETGRDGTTGLHFLSGGDEMGARMRAHDWTRSPLGQPGGWPQSLRTLVSLLLTSKFPMFLAWGPELAFLYNDGYRPILGAKDRDALGRPFAEVWPEILPDILPLVERALAGEATFHENLPLLMERNGYPEVAFFTFSYSPVRDESGGVGGMFCACEETTDQVLATRRSALLLALGDRLRSLDDPKAAMSAAAEALGRHFGVARAGYGESDESDRYFVVEADWTDGSVPSVAGRHRMEDFGPEVIAELKRGRTITIADANRDPRTAYPSAVAAYAGIQARSMIVVPLVKDGRFRSMLYVHHPEPRRWTEDEVRLVEEVAERTRSAVDHARAETALKESERRFRTMADNAPVMVWVTDREGRCTYLSRSWYEFTGQSEAEGLGYGWTDATHPDDHARTLAAFVDANARRAPFRLEYRLRHRDGGYRWALDAAVPRFGEGGEFLGYIGSVIDIGERKRAEEALRESEARFRALADLVPAFVWFAAPGGDLLHLNDRWYEYTGQTPERALPHGWAEAVHPDDRERTRAVWDDARERGVLYEIEVRYRRRDGAYRWYLARAEPLRDASGAITGWFGTCTDIHDRVAAEQALRETERRLNAVLDNASVAIFLMDERQHCVYMNAAAERMTGYSLDETRGRPLHDVVHHTRPDGSHYPLSECPIDRALPHNNRERGEETFVHRDGRFYPVAFTASPIREEDGRPVGTIIEVRDITAEKEAERHRDLLVNELNHRVKNSLATVQAIANQSFRSPGDGDAARIAFLARIGALARAHDVLTRENWEGADLADVVEGVAAAHGGARVGADGDAEGDAEGGRRFRVAGPRVRLRPKVALSLALALNELSTNAAKYGALSTEAGRVEIAWSVEPGADGTGPMLRLSWRESGGPPVEAPSRRGFGTRLLERGLALELGGEVRLSYDRSGVSCLVTAPM
jgi:PAS domain S-box-containing protein